MQPSEPRGPAGEAGAEPAVDFSRRARPAELPEWMDAPCSYEEFRECVRDLGSVNRWTLAYRPTLRFLDRVAAGRGDTKEPLRVLDVGSGGGDTLRQVARWAESRGVAVELTGIDLNPHATQAARELCGGKPRYAAIRWITGDVFTEPAAYGSDVVLSSLMTHHMEDAEIARFLHWMEGSAQRGWFVSDLLRSAKAHRWFGVLARLMGWHRFVQHDGPVSIRRGFREEDWRRLLAEAGVLIPEVRLTRPVPGRMCVERIR